VTFATTPLEHPTNDVGPGDPDSTFAQSCVPIHQLRTSGVPVLFKQSPGAKALCTGVIAQRRCHPTSGSQNLEALDGVYEPMRAAPVGCLSWPVAARELSGLYAAWSRQIEGGRPGPLAQTADFLGRAGQITAEYARPIHCPWPRTSASHDRHRPLRASGLPWPYYRESWFYLRKNLGRQRPRMGVPVAIQRVGVVGCGLMGTGIAEAFARSGLPVVVVDVNVAALKSGKDRLTASIARATRAGKVTGEEAEAALGRIEFSTDLDALVAADLVVEAIVESEAEKVKVFQTLDEVVEAPDAVLASNTSSIPIMKLAMATRRPAQVVGIHFFNPVPVLPLVELVSSLLTSEDTANRASLFASDQLGKQVIRSKDRAGFIVNALLIPYLLSAVRMLESGFATAEDIDAGMVKGCAHPMGLLALADLIGLDTTVAVAVSLYEEFKEPLYAPPPLLARMVEAGLLGRKSGRGFFDYDG